MVPEVIVAESPIESLEPSLVRHAECRDSELAARRSPRFHGLESPLQKTVGQAISGEAINLEALGLSVGE